MQLMLIIIVVLSSLQLASCNYEEAAVQCRSNCPMLDFRYIVDTLLQQQRELCRYQCLTNFSDDLAETLKGHIEAISALLFHPPLNYHNRKYIISKFPYQSSEEAMTYCTAFGGYLAEVSDENEYRALQNFVLNTSSVDIVLISGSDAITEGAWIFQRTGGPVPFLDLIPGQPDNLGEEDCLNLWKQYGGKMNDLPCGFRSSQDRFMCELPRFY